MALHIDTLNFKKSKPKFLSNLIYFLNLNKRMQKVVHEEFSLESSLENTHGREAVFVSLARMQVEIRSIRMLLLICLFYFYLGPLWLGPRILFMHSHLLGLVKKWILGRVSERHISSNFNHVL